MDIETSIIRLFQLKQSMELSDLVTGSQIEENLKLNIEAIETVLSELETYKKMCELLAEEIALELCTDRESEETIKIETLERVRKEVEKDE